MKKTIISIMLMVFASSLLANAIELNTKELNAITVKDIQESMVETQNVIPEPKQEIMTPELQAKLAAQSLRKELEKLGITAVVNVIPFDPTFFPPVLILRVDFASSRDFEQAKHLFQENETGRYYYQGIEVFPRILHEKSQAKDAFEGLKACSIVDGELFFWPTLEMAVLMLQPCMKAVSQKYGVLVSASQSIMPDTSRKGIGILISGPLPFGNSVVIDLEYSLRIRNGYLLDWPADVKYLGEITPH